MTTIEIEAHELNGDMLLGHTDPRLPKDALHDTQAMVTADAYDDEQLVATVEIDPGTRDVIDIKVHEPDRDDDQQLVTDGGHDLTTCTCGADLTDSAELGTATAPKVGARGPNPAIQTLPAATCTECGEAADAMRSMMATVPSVVVRPGSVSTTAM